MNPRTCTLVSRRGLAKTEDPLTYGTEAALRGHSSVGRAVALQARLANPGFRNSPVRKRDSSTRPEYDFQPIREVRVP